MKNMFRDSAYLTFIRAVSIMTLIVADSFDDLNSFENFKTVSNFIGYNSCHL